MRNPQTLFKHRSLHLLVSTALSIAIGSTAALADDIETYRVEEIDPIGPNILFVLDESGSMDWTSCYRCNTTDTDPNQRMYQMRQAMRLLIQDESMDNVNAAILGYSGTRNYTYVHSDFARVGDGNNRTNLLNNVIGDAHTGGSHSGSLIHSGGTPSTPAMKDAMRWYRDDKSGVDSPVENWCEPNYIIFLTDGEPNTNQGDTSYEGTNCDNNETNWNWSNTDGSDSGARCTATIAEWGYDHRPLTDAAWNYGDNEAELQRFRNVITHTIGFHTSAGSVKEGYLREIAAKSLDEDPAHSAASFDNGYDTGDPEESYTGGRYARAANAEELLDALTDFVTSASSDLTFTYTAPAIPFNPDNAAISGDYIYVPMFNPDSTTLWKGNLKKYKVGVDDDGNLFLRDKNDSPVVNDQLVFNSVTDMWGTSNTDDSLVGGAAQHQTGTRNLLTRVGTDNTDLIRLHKDTMDGGNPAITADMLGDDVNTEAQRQSILEWINWESGDHNNFMAAPLHSSPAVVRYSSGSDVVLLPTTEGILHAFDGTTGAELWAYMPDEMLPKLHTLRQNSETQEPPEYGLDGPLTVYEYNDRKYAVVGMRRGGRNYYTLDITNRNSPAFAWEIIGGDGSFSSLAQTWSKPMLTKLRVGGTEQEALIFAGGYNASVQDVATGRLPDTLGTSVYIVSPSSGALLASYSVSTNSVPANLLPVDINANGVTDRLYYADVGGRILRIDIPDNSFADTTVRSGIIADINSGTGANAFRRFFNTPEVGYFSRGGVQYLAVLVGTGHRPEPLDMPSTSEADRFYMIKDNAVWQAPADGNYTTVTHTTLTEAAQGNTIVDGWYMDVVHNGETFKVFSNARLYDNAVLFTGYRGYTEGAQSDDPCVANAAKGKSAFFALSMTSGSGVFEEMGADPDNPESGRSKYLKIPGIPPSPTLLFPGNEGGDELGGVVSALVGLEEVQQWPDRFHPVSWEEVIDEE